MLIGEASARLSENGRLDWGVGVADRFVDGMPGVVIRGLPQIGLGAAGDFEPRRAGQGQCSRETLKEVDFLLSPFSAGDQELCSLVAKVTQGGTSQQVVYAGRPGRFAKG